MLQPEGEVNDLVTSSASRQPRELHQWRHRLRLLIGALVLVLIAAFLALPPLLRIPAQLLVRDEPGGGTYDAVAVLLGDGDGTRARTAAELFLKSGASAIVLASSADTPYVAAGVVPPEANIVRNYLAVHGIALDHIKITSRRVTSTYEEAGALRDFLLELFPDGEIHAAVVTNWYHTARSRWVFDKACAGTRVRPHIRSAATMEAGPENWWTNEGTFLAVYDEYLKLVYYLFKYGW